MGITAYHVFTSPVADGTNTQFVRPSNWNSEHLLTLNAVGSEISGAFSNANNVTFALETNGRITASASYPAQTEYVFSNGNGVSFGTNGSTVTATVRTDYLTTAAQSNHSHGNPTLALTNLSGTTASASNGLTISLSAAAGGGGADGYNILAAGTQTAGTANTVLFNNANGITFGMANSSVITASHNGITQQSTQPAVAQLNGSSGTLSLAVGSSLSASTNGSTITFGLASNITTALQPAGNYLTTARASNDAVGLNTALTAGPLAWTVNSNGISLNAGSAAGTTSGFTGGASISGSMTHNTAGLAISLAHPAWITTAAVSNHSHGDPTLALTNLSGTTASASNGFTISLSAAAPGGGGAINVSAGTTSGNLQTIQFDNGNGVSFGLNGSTVTASVNAGGAGRTVDYFDAFNNAVYLAGQAGQGTLQFFPVQIANAVQFDRFAFPVQFTAATGSTGSMTISQWVGFYTQVNSTQISLAHSFSGTTGVSHNGTQNSASNIGPRVWTMGATSTIDGGIYYVGFLSRTTTAGANLTMSNWLMSGLNSQHSGRLGAAINQTDHLRPFAGKYTATTSALPASVGRANIDGTSLEGRRPPLWQLWSNFS